MTSRHVFLSLGFVAVFGLVALVSFFAGVSYGKEVAGLTFADFKEKLAAEKKPSPLEPGDIRNIQGDDDQERTVPAADSEYSISRANEFEAKRYAEGLLYMVQKGQLFDVPVGTRVTVKKVTYNGVEVDILDTGLPRTVWVAKRYIRTD